jgi:hypothetical protein
LPQEEQLRLARTLLEKVEAQGDLLVEEIREKEIDGWRLCLRMLACLIKRVLYPEKTTQTQGKTLNASSGKIVSLLTK